MSVFSITALDRLIESDRRSSSSSAVAASSENGSTAVERQKENPAPAKKERRPLYVSYPYSSTTTSAASTPPPRPSPSPTSFSPSPYVVNHKRRVPNGGGDSKQRASQQNGFHVSVSEKSSVTQPSESQQELVSMSGNKQNINSQDSPPSDGSIGSQGQDGSFVKDQSSRSPQSSLTLQFLAKNVNSKGNSTDGDSWYRKPNSDEIYFDGSLPTATEEKTKAGKRVGSVERREMSSRTNDPRGKKKLEESSAAAEGGSSSRVTGNAGSSTSSMPEPSVTDSRTSSNSGSEEWFDASEGLPDYVSDDESRRNSSSDPGPSSRGDPDFNIILQLKAEMQRRSAAEDAREALQHQRDGMAQMLSSAGISVPQSDLGDLKVTETDKVLGVSDSESQRLMVARYVAGAVATGAVRAEAEAELQTVLAEKSKEIARLKDKLQYYELVNHEMSQRNQESIENARQSRRRRQRMQRFVVFGLSAAVCVGVSVAAVYHYAPWEHVKDLSKEPVLPEGGHANPVSLEQVVDLQDLNPEN